MKTFNALFLFFFLPFIVVAQHTAPKDSVEGRFYVGISASNTSYHLTFNKNSLHANFSPISTIHIGYRFNNKLSLQLGFTYGEHNYNSSAIYYKSVDSTIYLNQSFRSGGFAMPVTLRYDFLNIGQRLQLYGTASLVPVYGLAHQKHTETLDGDTRVTYNSKASGFSLITTAGLGLNYRISKRLDGYGEFLLLNRNLAAFGIRPTQPNFGFGLIYRF